MYRRNNTKTLQIVLICLVAVLCVSLLATSFATKKDDYTRTNINWTVGGMTNGAFDEKLENQMVSQRVEIGKGIKIAPEFNKTVSYQVYYYNDSDTFIGQESETDITNILELTLEEIQAEHDGATYFRVVMTPNDKDGEITGVEKLGYASHVKVYELDK